MQSPLNAELRGRNLSSFGGYPKLEVADFFSTGKQEATIMIKLSAISAATFFAMTAVVMAGPTTTDHRSGQVTDHRGGPVVTDHRGTSGPVIAPPGRGPFRPAGDPTNGAPPVVTQNPPQRPGVIVDPCRPGQCAGGQHGGQSWNSRGFFGFGAVPASYTPSSECFFEKRRFNGVLRVVKVCAE
jgi:hypothetical protein